MTGERRDDWCPQEELAVGWAMHSLEPDEEARLRAHLPGCARCRKTVRATEEVTATLGGSVRQYEPPARLRSRLMAAVENTPQEHVARPPATPAPVRLDARRRSGGVGRRLVAAAAVVVALAGIGVVAVRFNQLGDQVTAQEQRARDLNAALALAADPKTERAVMRSSEGTPVAVVLSGPDKGAVMEMSLAPTGADQMYVVWGTTTPNPTPLAKFDVSRGESVRFVAWGGEAHKHQGFAISLEPKGEMPAAPSTSVGSGPVVK